MENNSAEVIKDNSSKKITNINWFKVLEYSLPALIAIIVFIIAMIVKGVFPFGTNSIGYIDFNDGLIPSYTTLWDVLHGKFDVLVSWNLGAGGSFFTSFILNSFLSPISWIVALFARESIIYSIALVVIIMFALMATTSYICFKKIFKDTNKYILLLFSLVWTYSGWTLVHFTNVGWLNLMILLPLLLLSAKKLVEEHKIFWFVVILTYMLMLSYYITYMILVGLVIVATLYIFILAKERKKISALLFFAIIISILISMVVFIPTCITSLQAHRFSGTATANPKAELFDHFFSKLAIIVMYALPIVFFVKLLLTYKKDKKNVLFFMLTFIVLILGLFIEPINKMWHTGSYYCFPYRYSFVIVFFLIFASLYYINKYLSVKEMPKTNIEEDKLKQNKNSKIFWVGLSIVSLLAIVFSVVLSSSGSNIIPYRTTKIDIFIAFLMPFICTYIFIEMSLKIKSSKLSLAKLSGGVLIFVLCIAQVLGYTIGYCSLNNGTNNERITNVFSIDVSYLDDGYKIKDKENLYNYNFPLLLDYASLTSWIHISSEEQYVGYNKLGYGTVSTLLKSAGGTILTDILLGNKYVLSMQNLNEEYYTLLNSFDFVEDNKTEKVNLYELNFNFDLVYTMNTDLTELLESSNDWFENHNTLYKALYNKVNDIITPVDYSITQIEKDEYKIQVSNLSGSNIYMQNKMLDSFTITQNGYEYEVYNGLVDLGINSESTIEITCNIEDSSLQEVKEKLSFGSFDIQTFKQVHNEKALNNSKLNFDGKSIKVSINNANNDKYLFIPYTYLKNMAGTVNEASVEVKQAFDTFMFVEIQQGQNEIVVTYKPQLLNICLIITIMALAVFIALTILGKFFKIINNNIVVWIGVGGACLILGIVGFLVFLKPFFNFLVLLF